MNISDCHPTTRFSDRALDYTRYRPSYPPALIDHLNDSIGLKGKTVADIGFGTGIFTKLLLDNGNTVFGIEPNNNMLATGCEFLKNYQTFTALSGSAEQTNLDANFVDVITCAQAFHWFDPQRTKSEFYRILKSGGNIVLIWNYRDSTETKLGRTYEALLKEYCRDYEVVGHRNIKEAILDDFFSPHRLVRAEFNYEQTLDFQGLMGRLRSVSYAPLEVDDAYAKLHGELKKLFDECQCDGLVCLQYKTRVFYYL